MPVRCYFLLLPLLRWAGLLLAVLPLACAERGSLPRDPLRALDEVVAHSEQRLREIHEYRADYWIRTGGGPRQKVRIYYRTPPAVTPSAGYSWTAGDGQNAAKRLPGPLPAPLIRLEVPSDKRVEIARAGSWMIYDSTQTPVHRSMGAEYATADQLHEQFSLCNLWMLDADQPLAPPRLTFDAAFVGLSDVSGSARFTLVPTLGSPAWRARIAPSEVIDVREEEEGFAIRTARRRMLIDKWSGTLLSDELSAANGRVIAQQERMFFERGNVPKRSFELVGLLDAAKQQPPAVYRQIFASQSWEAAMRPLVSSQINEWARLDDRAKREIESLAVDSLETLYAYGVYTETREPARPPWCDELKARVGQYYSSLDVGQDPASGLELDFAGEMGLKPASPTAGALADEIERIEAMIQKAVQQRAPWSVSAVTGRELLAVYRRAALEALRRTEARRFEALVLGCS